MAYNLSTEKKALAISILAEGNSIRSIERVTEIHRDTIMRLGVRVGEACRQIMDEKMRGLSCSQIEVDEIWGFIGSKQKNAVRTGDYGDVWTFIALDSPTKLIPTFVVGKRDAYHAKAFMADLAVLLLHRVQVSSDALRLYVDAAERAFGSEVDYGQIVKTYSFINVRRRICPQSSGAAPSSTSREPVSVGLSPFFSGAIGQSSYNAARGLATPEMTPTRKNWKNLYARALVVRRRNCSPFGRQPRHDLQMDRAQENARSQGRPSLEIPGLRD